MDKYKAIKSIEGLNAAQLANIVKHNFVQYGPEYVRMIVREKMTGEDFLNAFNYNLDTYLDPEQEKRLWEFITWILENPKQFYSDVETLERREIQSASHVPRYENIPEKNSDKPLPPPRKPFYPKPKPANNLPSEDENKTADINFKRKVDINSSGKFSKTRSEFKPIREIVELPSLKNLQISLSSTNNNKKVLLSRSFESEESDSEFYDPYETITTVVYEREPVVETIPKMLEPFLGNEKPPLPKKPNSISQNLKQKTNKLSTLMDQCNFDQSRNILDVSREDGHKILENEPEGSFLLRTSRTQFCTLMVKSDRRIANIQIASKNGKYYLYSENIDKAKIQFNNLDSLVEYYQSKELPLMDLKLTLRDNFNFKYTKGVFHLPNLKK